MGGCCSATKPKNINEERKRPVNLEYKNKKQDECIEIQCPETELNELFDILKDEDGNINSQ